MRAASAPRTGQVLVAVLSLAAAASAFLAATPWLRAYQVPAAPYLLALAAVVPVVITVLVSRSLRIDALVSYAVSATGLVVLLGASDNYNFQQVWYGLAHVPAQLLTETPPLAGSPYLLAAPVALTWLCAAASAELLLRPRRPASIALALPVAYFALAFGATTSAPPGETTAAATSLLGALVVAALARQGLIDAQLSAVPAGTVPTPGAAGGAQDEAGPMTAIAGSGARPHRHSSLRRALTGAVLAAIVAVASGTVVHNVSAFASKPATLTRASHLVSGTVVNPLDKLASLRDSSPSARPAILFTVQVNHAWSGYLNVATLDHYDGDQWSFSTTFRPTGGRIPTAQVVSEPGARDLVQHYRMLRPIGLPFLPDIDRPTAVEGVAVDADARDGMLAALVPVPSSYQVSSHVPVGTGAELPAASVLASGASVPGGDSAAYTALPDGAAKDIAAAVRFSINLTGRPASPSFAFLQSLAGALRVHEKRASAGASPGAKAIPAALAGTSLAQVINAVTVDRAATPEQFATFFAVVARYLGVRARVVTGFRVPAAATSIGPLPPGRYRLANRDAWAWAEIPVLGYGWVIVDPTPVLTTADASAPAEQVKAVPPTKPPQAAALPGKGAAHAIAKPVTVRLPRPPLHVNWPVLLGAVLPGGLLVALLAVSLGTPALRRRLRRLARHQTGDPTALAAGAWLELVDGLSRLGLEIVPSATSTDVAAQVADHFGEDFAPPVRMVAEVADQALFSTKWPVDQPRAQLAWDSQQALYRELRHRISRGDRARSLLTVGPSPSRPSTQGPV